eukprot:2283699-Rhodomonas_salina.1
MSRQILRTARATRSKSMSQNPATYSLWVIAFEFAEPTSQEHVGFIVLHRRAHEDAHCLLAQELRPGHAHVKLIRFLCGVVPNRDSEQLLCRESCAGRAARGVVPVHEPGIAPGRG